MGFDEKAATWDASQRRRELAKAIAESIKESVELKPNMHILDVGAGTGLLTREIISFVASVTGVDSSQKMLEKFEQIGKKCIPLHCDIIKYQPQRSFDGVISSMTMHHIEDTREFFEKLNSLLKPEGFIAIADLEKEDGSFHDHGNEGVHHFGFDKEELFELAKEGGFFDISIKEVYRVKKPNREYPVLLLVAKKGRSSIL